VVLPSVSSANVCCDESSCIRCWAISCRLSLESKLAGIALPKIDTWAFTSTGTALVIKISGCRGNDVSADLEVEEECKMTCLNLEEMALKLFLGSCGSLPTSSSLTVTLDRRARRFRSLRTIAGVISVGQ